MRNLFALLFVAAAFTFVACEKKETANGGDSTKMDSAAADTKAPAPVQDSTMAPAGDSAKADSAKVK